MRIVALISWYNERAPWLAATTASVAPFADHIVAIDGAYGLYPEGRRHSPTDQAEAIRETARTAGMGCTIHEPPEIWQGNEIGKRSALFRLGEAVTDERDWYFVIDGDAVITEVGCDVKAKCASTTRDCGDVTMWNYRQHVSPDQRQFVTAMTEQQAIRVMFRAIRGLHVTENHYTYQCPDGRRLWGDSPGTETAEDFTAIRMEHRNHLRDPWRAHEAKAYYAAREQQQIERQYRP